VSRAAAAAGSYGGVLLLASSDTAVRFLLAPYLTEDRALTTIAVGVLVAILPVSALLVRVPAGAVYAARRGPALLLGFGALSVGCLALLGAGPAVGFTAVLLVGSGIGWSVCTTVQLAALVGARSAGTMATMGWYAAITSLGHASGTAVFGVLAEHAGYQPSFLVVGAVQLTGVALALPDALRTARTAPAEPDRTVESTSDGRRPLPGLVWSGALLMCYINLLTGVVQTFYPLLAASHGRTLTSAGFLLSAMSVASMAVRLLSTTITRIAGGAWLTLALVGLSTAATAVLPLGLDVVAWQLCLFVAMGLSRGLLRVTGSAQAFDAVRDRDKAVGMTSALLFAGLDLGKVAAPVLAGALAALVGLGSMFSVSAGACLVAYAGARQVIARRSET
jgi:MFS family permease